MVENAWWTGVGRFAPSETRCQAITIFAGDVRQFLRDLQNPWYIFFASAQFASSRAASPSQLILRKLELDLASATARLRFTRRENFLFESIVTH